MKLITVLQSLAISLESQRKLKLCQQSYICVGSELLAVACTYTLFRQDITLFL